MLPEGGPIRALLDRLRAEVGDDPDLLQQAFEDTNAIDRQNHRINYESRVE
jgi:hypothetical protein